MSDASSARGPRKTTSLIWDYFERFDDDEHSNDKRATCKVCFEDYSYATTITNLKQHLQKKHPDVCPAEFTKERVPRQNRHRNTTLWAYYTKVLYSRDLKVARCNLCRQERRYTTTICNLKDHLLKTHPADYERYLQNLPPQFDQLAVDPDNDDDKLKPVMKTTSHIWDFFTKLVGKEQKAECNICNGKYAYRSTIMNLTHHLRKMHGDEHGKYLHKSGLLNNDTEDTSSEKTNSEKRSKPVMKTTSHIWDFFTKLDGEVQKAECNICKGEYSYRSTIMNLTHHLRKMHGDEHEKYLQKSGLLNNDTEDTSSEKTNSEKRSKPQMKTISLIWEYFTKLEGTDRKAECNICYEEFSYCSTILNLNNHLKKQHGAEHKQFLRNSGLLNNVPEDSCSETTYSEIESKILMETTSAYAEVWNHFTKVEGADHKAQCQYCNGEFSYRSTVSNLSHHIRIMHSVVHRKYFKKFEPENDESKQRTKTTLLIWDYFTKLPGPRHKAECNICHGILSYHSTVSNLNHHLRKKHEDVHRKYLQDSGLQDNISVSSCSQNSDNEGDDESEETHNKVWNYFEQEGTKARCVVCRELVHDSAYEYLKDHLFEHHPKLLLNIVQEQEKKEKHEVESNADSNAGSNTEDNTYTEVVYLERESSPEETRPQDPLPKISTTFTQKGPKKRTSSSSSDRPIAKYKKDTTPEKTEDDSELEAFIKYIRCLLKKLSPDAFSKVQVDILKTIMDAQSNSKISLTDTCSLSILSDINGSLNNVIRVSEISPENCNLISNYTVALAKGNEVDSCRKD